MHDDLTTMWYCVGWLNARCSDHHVVLCWLEECTMIWPPCGTVLTGGMKDDLTAIWYCIGWWNAQWSDCHVVLCWLVECMMIWPPCGPALTGGLHNDLTTPLNCVDLPCGELRTQKLKSHLVKTPSLNILPLKPGVGQYIAIHTTLTARDFFFLYFYPSGPFTRILSKTSPDFSCVGCG